jgi:ribonucleotide monophosphatase NagD (HAD superfamily)
VNAVLEENVSDVLVAFDPNFNYTKMLRAASYINNGANFIVTNEDAVCFGLENKLENLLK